MLPQFCLSRDNYWGLGQGKPVISVMCLENRPKREFWLTIGPLDHWLENLQNSRFESACDFFEFQRRPGERSGFEDGLGRVGWRNCSTGSAQWNHMESWELCKKYQVWLVEYPWKQTSWTMASLIPSCNGFLSFGVGTFSTDSLYSCVRRFHLTF